MEQKKNIYQKLQECRVDLQAMNLKKSGRNTFSNFTYYELADFLPAVNELFLQNGLFSNFSILDGVATLTIMNAEETTERIEFTSPVADLVIKGANAIQALGGTHTYLKRYLYLNALEIVEADLFDATSGKPESQPKPQNKPQKAPYSASYNPQPTNTQYQPKNQKMTDFQRQVISGLPANLKNYACETIGVASIEEFTEVQAQQFIDFLVSKKLIEKPVKPLEIVEEGYEI